VISIPFQASMADDPLGLGDYRTSPSQPAAGPASGYSAYSSVPTNQQRTRGASSGSKMLLWAGLGVAAAIVAVIAITAVVVVPLLRSSKTAGVEDVAAAAQSNSPTASSTATPSSPTPPRTPPASPASSSAAAPPGSTWTVTADPPRTPIAWPETLDLNIPIAEDGNQILYPAVPSPFVVVGLNSIGKPGVEAWDLLKGQRTGLLSAPTKSTVYALSPDGAFLAAQPSGFEGRGKVYLYSLVSGQQTGELTYGDESANLQYFAFTKPNELVTHFFGSGPKGFAYKIRVWSVPEGKQLQDMELAGFYQNTRLALSPGGRYLAGIEGNDKLSVFDLQAGKLAGYLLLEQLMGERAGTYYGMSFSPDGKQLGVVFADTNSRVVFVDLATGKLADSLAFAGKPPTASAYQGAAIEWLGDRAWCLFGGTIIDRKTRRLVWNLDLPITSRLLARRTLVGGWIAPTGPSRRTSLRLVSLPAAEIQASLAALDGSSAAHLRPGMSVSLDITVGKLQHGTPDDTKKRLAEIFAERFQADAIQVADAQPLVLKVVYDESQGPLLQERQGIVGKATGRTVQGTKVHLKLDLASRDGARSFFQHDIDYDPHGVTIIGQEVNEATVRDSIFRQLLYTLSATPIPYFVPQESGMSNLPGVTKVP